MSGPKKVKVSDPKTESVRSKILLKISESVRSEKVKVSGPNSNKNQLEFGIKITKSVRSEKRETDRLLWYLFMTERLLK